MSAARPADILRHLEQTGAADADLLARFVASNDAGAFAELVRRHGALVLGVCRRVTGHRQDAEDAFQATFLVLARKAASLQNPARLGNWLYGVAYRVARRAKRAATRRRVREVSVAAPPEPQAIPAPALWELAPILDEELAALPAHYRDAIVLCDLRDTPREEAARVLAVPEGTLSSRLANGRKKLAARLTKRGVALSAAALPLALADARAAGAVTSDLVARTSGLAADFAARGAVPGVLSHLLEGGFAVRKALVLSALLGAAVAGAVFAAQGPKDGPPKPPAVAEKPRPKVESKPGANAVAFTDKPKLREAFDVGVTNAIFMWNATGTHFAVEGREAIAVEPKFQAAVRLYSAGAKPQVYRNTLDQFERLVGVASDGMGIMTRLSEEHLISGRNMLRFWVKQNRDGVATNDLIVDRTVELDPKTVQIFSFTAVGKTCRALAYERSVDGVLSNIEVLEIDVTNGKTAKLLLRIDDGLPALAPDGKRLAVLNKDVTKVTVYDLDRGAKGFDHTFAPDKTPELRRENQEYHHLIFSPNGRRLVVSRGIGRTDIFNTDTGELQPALEGASLAQTSPDSQAFTGDGRLFASLNTTYVIKTGNRNGRNQTWWDSVETFLTVWDTQTGKVLKTWKSPHLWVAFNPARPLLAVLEPNGANNTRVGFWDFAADAGKK